ncbi:hypothetical protein Gorai_019978 [Gossypium raimondii]|uniref:RNase H type-1 domain-containing protein n=1 Tax=Gossypium raimondii TaxID=29730 RepID=A0A7J8PQN5_GOSRA|nr:hypothetical protein [Gossypium raimondii]
MCSLLHWSHLEKGWIKLNTDGAVSSSSPTASIGGVFKDLDANWLGGASSSLVELRLLHQLLRRWKVRIRHILRIQNVVADHMAKCTAIENSSLQLFEDPSASMQGLLFADRDVSILG